MTKEEMLSELKKLSIIVNEDTINKLDILAHELVEYNKHTNLTSIIELEEIYLKHFFDSATITKVIDLSEIDNLIDIGTGAGFPGLIIKLLYPEVNVTLLDSNNKKIKWLEFISNKLEIKVNIVYDRVENYSKKNLNAFDVVTSRAVSNLRVLSEISLPLVKKGGYFIPLKGNVDEELKESMPTLNCMSAKLIKKETFKLYNGEGIRNVLLITKTGETKVSSLREYDKIIKNH